MYSGQYLILKGCNSQGGGAQGFQGGANAPAPPPLNETLIPIVFMAVYFCLPFLQRVIFPLLTHNCTHLHPRDIHTSRTQLQHQDSMDTSLRATSPAPAYSPVTSPQRLDRPMDERLHNRRPSDEASQILRKISGAGMPGYNYFVDKHMSLPVPFRHSIPTESSSFHDFSEFTRHQYMFGTGEPGCITCRVRTL